MTDTEAQTRPLRIQRRRTKGWRLPPNTVCVTRPGKHGNLWTVGLVNCGCRTWGECTHNSFRCETAKDAVAAFRAWKGEVAKLNPERHAAAMEELRGKNLACYCKLCDAHKDGKPLGLACPDCEPCHSDVLGEIANG